MGLLTRWREFSRQYGSAGLIRHLAARAVRPFWERAELHLLVIESAPPALQARAPIRVAELTPDLAAAAGLRGSDWEDRWRQGDVCYGAWLNGECVHHSWVTKQDTYIAEGHGWIRLAAGEAYIYDCFTSGSCRGLGIFPAVLTEIIRRLQSEGSQRTWIAVEQENISSRKAIERAGFRPACTLTYRRYGTLVRRNLSCRTDGPNCNFDTNR